MPKPRKYPDAVIKVLQPHVHDYRCAQTSEVRSHIFCIKMWPAVEELWKAQGRSLAGEERAKEMKVTLFLAVSLRMNIDRLPRI